MALQPTTTSKKGYRGGEGKSVYIHMAIWRNEKTGQIHITGPKEGTLHSTISCEPGSKRCHENLFKKFKKILEREKRW
ncbi:MAG: hypothetical protein ABIL68_01975 [bacterium]